MKTDRIAVAVEAEDRRFKAMADGDLEMLEEVLADDLHYTHANGMVEDKAEFIRRIASGERDYRKVEVIGRRACEQNGFVIVFGQIQMEVMRKAGLLETTLEYTAVYRDGDPRLFAWAATKTFA